MHDMPDDLASNPVIFEATDATIERLRDAVLKLAA